MKAKLILIGTMAVGVAGLSAQTSDKPATVRIKKTEIINGVEKTTDTTFTTNDPSSIKMGEGSMKVMEWDSKEGGEGKKVIIINANKEMRTGEDGKDIVISDDGQDIKIEEGANGEKKITVHGSEPAIIINAEEMKGKEGERTMTKSIVVKRVGKCNATEEEIKNAKEEYHITIVKLVELSEAEKALLGKSTGLGDNQLAIDKMDFYPNPNNGKFNLRFNLKDKGNTDINIMNMEGKTIYSEKLNDFTGNYDKEIDISKNPKGVYFVRINQGKHSQLKKIVLE